MSVRRPAYFPRIAGRFRRTLLGYKPSEVDEALHAQAGALTESADALARVELALGAKAAELGEALERVAHLELVCSELSARVVERDAQLEELRRELDRARAESATGLAALVRLADELAAIRRQARGQATRIRLRALRDAAELSERLAETADGGAARARVLAGVEEAIARIGEGLELSGEEPDREAGEARGPVRAGEIFEGDVEIEVGPFDDFSQLVGFEDAAGGIGATSEISVKRFTGGRATLAMKLEEPIELLRELEERAPFEFKVRDRRFDRLVLDLGE